LDLANAAYVAQIGCIQALEDIRMFDDDDDPFLTIDEAAELLRVSRRTLDNYRYRKVGPPYRRHGGRIVYRLSDLIAWSEQRRVRHPKRNKADETPPLHHDAARDRHRRPRVPKGRRSDPPLERQPQRPDRLLSTRLPAAPAGGAGRHPPP
jgi:hypothetical protein